MWSKAPTTGLGQGLAKRLEDEERRGEWNGGIAGDGEEYYIVS